MKPIIELTHQGAPVVNCAWVSRRTLGMVVIDIDMHSKYCEVGAQGRGLVLIGAGESALKLLDGKHREEFTHLTFPCWRDWDVVATSAGRYTITVVLARPQGWLHDLIQRWVPIRATYLDA